MEAVREKFEEVQVRDIERAAQAALQSVEKQINIITDRLLRSMNDPAVRRELSRQRTHESTRSSGHTLTAHLETRSPVAFLQTRAALQKKDSIVVQVHEGEAASADSVAAQITKIRALENERAWEESQTFREVAAEMNDLVTLFSTELEAQVDKEVRGLLSSQPSLSFLERAEADVRVVPADGAYPTVEKLASDMERRRDIAENLVRARLTMEKLQLMQAANNLAKEKLEAVIGVIRRAMK